VGSFLVACSFRNIIDDFVWMFAGVYGPNDDVKRTYLWDELVGLMSWWELSWYIGVISMFVFQVKDHVTLDKH
jgi:hypothetical protein